MSRILFFLLLAALAWIWFFKRPSVRDGSGRRERAPQQKPVERIVQCAHCGLRLPEGEALAEGEQRHFCSVEHRNAHIGRD